MTDRSYHLPRDLIAFFWRFVLPYRKVFAGQLLMQLIDSCSVSLNSYLIGKIIDDVTNYQANSGLNLLASLAPTVFALLALDQFNQIALAIYDYLKLKTSTRIKADVIDFMYTYVQQHAYHYFKNMHTGSLVNKISDMARSTVTILEQIVSPLFSEIATTIIAIISMYLVHPLFGIILAIWSPIYLISAAVFTTKTLKLSTICSEANSTCMGRISDGITNIITIKLFSRSKYEREYLLKYINDTKIKNQDLQWYMLKVKYFQSVFVTILLGCIIYTLIYAKSRSLVTVGDFSIILWLSYTIIHSLWMISSYCIIFFENIGICKQALPIITIPHAVQDRPNALPLKITKGEIIFDKVSFSYENKHKIFSNRSITIKGGEKVGLVGFSGSGKSTFVSLILRLYEPYAGKILIDDQDLATITQNSLREQIAMVPQDPSLLHRTLLENIQYGNLAASPEDILVAAKKAHCHEFIELLPAKYQTLVGERGVKLSGGQRQRITIARAILKNAPILILDEATSSLDSATEKKIQASLNYLMQHATTIVIAHRLSTLYAMDRILVFKDGEIIEDGTHAELIALNGHYTQLWQMQAGGLLPYQNANSPKIVEQDLDPGELPLDE